MADNVYSNEEIIELQDLRLSPIPSLRHRNNKLGCGNVPSTADNETNRFPPSFRMVGSQSRYTYPTSRGGGCSRRNRFQNAIPRRFRFLQNLRKGAGALKVSLPRIKDVNIIDKYSRVIFPVSFIIFNAVYWCFYVF